MELQEDLDYILVEEFYKKKKNGDWLLIQLSEELKLQMYHHGKNHHQHMRPTVRESGVHLGAS